MAIRIEHPAYRRRRRLAAAADATVTPRDRAAPGAGTRGGAEHPRPAPGLQRQPPGPLEPEPPEGRGCAAELVRPHVERAADAHDDPRRRNGVRIARDPSFLLRCAEATRTIAGELAATAWVRLRIALGGLDHPVLRDRDAAAGDRDPHAREAPPPALGRALRRRRRRRRRRPPARRAPPPIRTRSSPISTPGHRRTRRPARSDSITATPVPSGRARSADRRTSAYVGSARACRRISGFGVKIRIARSPSRQRTQRSRSARSDAM